MYGKCYLQCDTFHFHEIEAHWKSATLDLGGGFVGLFGFALFFSGNSSK